MTREEREAREAAIAYLKSYRKLDEDLYNTAPKDSISYYATDKCLKYWDMAIQTLSQEPCDGWCEIPSDEMTLEQARQAVKDLRKKLAEYLDQEPSDTVSRGVFEQVIRERDIAIEQLHDLGYELGQKIEPCDDAISREDAVRKLRADTLFVCTGDKMQAISDIESLLPVMQKPIECGDAISREMALKECYVIVVEGARYRVIQEETLLGLPPVTPKQRVGHWIHLRSDMYECSECGKIYTSFEIGKCDADYCPKCGAKMESKKENDKYFK